MDTAIQELVKNEEVNREKGKNRKYSENVKKFAFTLFYYSPRAYKYLRTVLTLPAPRTIQTWLENIDCEPGFLTNVFDILAKEQMPFSLVIDSMAIRKRLIVNRYNSTIKGFVDLGADDNAPEQREVTEALVFLLVSVTKRLRYSVGYFFVDKIEADVQVKLITQCLEMAQQKSIDIVNITCDGCRANVSTLTKLGASLPLNLSFKHPSSDTNVSSILTSWFLMRLYLFCMKDFHFRCLLLLTPYTCSSFAAMHLPLCVSLSRRLA